MCCLVAACSISHILEETSCQFVSRRMLVWRWYSETNIYLGLSCLFILYCFSSWTSGNKQQVHFHVGKWRLDFSIISLPKEGWGPGFHLGPHSFFLHYDCFLLTFTVISAAKQHSIVLVCNSSPRESQWAHLKMWSVAWGMVLIVLAIFKWEGCWEGTNKESCFLIYVECRMLSPPSAFTKSVIYSHCYQHLLWGCAMFTYCLTFA